MGIIKVLFSHVLGLDGLIILLSLFNLLFIALRVRNITKSIDAVLRQVIYLPLKHVFDFFSSSEPSINLQGLYVKHEKEERWFQAFISLTDILPLLGILGTVLALLQTQLFEVDAIRLHFTSALTSTFWGLIGAIGCKLVEGSLLPGVEQNRRNIEMLIKQTEAYSEKNHA